MTTDEEKQNAALELLADPRLAPLTDALGDLMSMTAHVVALEPHRRTPDIAKATRGVEDAQRRMMAALARDKDDAAKLVANLPRTVAPMRAALDKLRAAVDPAIGKQIVDNVLAKVRRDDAAKAARL